MDLITLFQSISDIFGAIAHFPSLGLIVLLIAVFMELVIAIAVLRSDAKNATNIIFFLLSIATIFWLIVFYLGYLPSFYGYTILLARFGIFFAAAMSSLFYLLADTLPSPKINLKPLWYRLTLGATALMMILNISPYAFTSGTSVVDGAVHPVPGPGFA